MKHACILKDSFFLYNVFRKLAEGCDWPSVVLGSGFDWPSVVIGRWPRPAKCRDRPKAVIGHTLRLTEGGYYCCELCCLLLLFRDKSRDWSRAGIDCAKCYSCELSLAEHWLAEGCDWPSVAIGWRLWLAKCCDWLRAVIGHALWLAEGCDWPRTAIDWG